MLFVLSAGLASAALSRSFLLFVMRCKRFVACGAGIFTVRSLSSRLHANAVMMGVLTVLLSVAVIGVNLFSAASAVATAESAKNYLFDILASRRAKEGETADYGAAMEIIESYAPVRSSHVYTVYDGPSETYVTESDFAAICAMVGYTMPALEGGYIECKWGETDGEIVFDAAAAGEKSVVFGETAYVCIGTLYCSCDLIKRGNTYGTFLVVPDEAAARGWEEFYSLAVVLADPHYDVEGMQAALAASDGVAGRETLFDCREEVRLNALRMYSPFLLISFSVAALFILMTMAMIALKMLSMVAEDRERYRTLWRLGTSEGTLGKSLFTQMFFFCFLPFAVPVASCFPLVGVLRRLFGLLGTDLSVWSIAAQVAGAAGIILLFYALYFAVSYLVAAREVKKSLRAVG